MDTRKSLGRSRQKIASHAGKVIQRKSAIVLRSPLSPFSFFVPWHIFSRRRSNSARLSNSLVPPPSVSRPSAAPTPPFTGTRRTLLRSFRGHFKFIIDNSAGKNNQLDLGIPDKYVLQIKNSVGFGSERTFVWPWRAPRVHPRIRTVNTDRGSLTRAQRILLVIPLVH